MFLILVPCRLLHAFKLNIPFIITETLNNYLWKLIQAWKFQWLKSVIDTEAQAIGNVFIVLLIQWKGFQDWRAGQRGRLAKRIQGGWFIPWKLVWLWHLFPCCICWSHHSKGLEKMLCGLSWLWLWWWSLLLVGSILFDIVLLRS